MRRKRENSVPRSPGLWMVHFTRFITNPVTILIFLAAAALGVAGDGFLSPRTCADWISSGAVYFLVALGVSGCIISGGTDLSAGCQTGFAACLSAFFLRLGDNPDWFFAEFPAANPLAALLPVLCAGALFGLLNGLAVAVWKVPPFLATLGTQSVVYGLSAALAGGSGQISAITAVPDNTAILSGAALIETGGPRGISMNTPFLLFIALGAGILFQFFYQYTRYGRYLYAVGGNAEAAELSGIPVAGTRIRAYIAAGILYALSGWVLALDTGGAGNAGMDHYFASGVGLEAEAIAGCVIGGVSVTGGYGSVPGIFGGVLTLELLRIVLRFLGVGPALIRAAQGVVLILAVALDTRGRRKLPR